MKPIVSRVVPGGYMVTVEVPGAYTKPAERHPLTGEITDSRFDEVFVPFDRIAGQEPDDVAAALVDLLEVDPIERVRDVDLREWSAFRSAGIEKPIAVLEEFVGKDQSERDLRKVGQ